MAGARDDTNTITAAVATDPIPTTPSSADNKSYKGVRKRKWGKWVSEIRLPNSRERIWLGSYDSPEKAARAFDAALYCLRGRHANFNFPDTPFNLDINVAAAGHQSLTTQEIQEVAAKFANEYPPHDHRNREPSQSSQRGASSFELFASKSNSNSGTKSTYTSTCTTTTTTTSSSSAYECDGTVQVDQHGDMRAMDWTFLNLLEDSNNEVAAASDCGLYSELDKMHSGELLLYSTPPPSPPFEDNGDEIEGGDAFTHHSFLWNWNF